MSSVRRLARAFAAATICLALPAAADQARRVLAVSSGPRAACKGAPAPPLRTLKAEQASTGEANEAGDDACTRHWRRLARRLETMLGPHARVHLDLLLLGDQSIDWSPGQPGDRAIAGLASASTRGHSLILLQYAPSPSAGDAGRPQRQLRHLLDALRRRHEHGVVLIATHTTCRQLGAGDARSVARLQRRAARQNLSRLYAGPDLDRLAPGRWAEDCTLDEADLGVWLDAWAASVGAAQQRKKLVEHETLVDLFIADRTN